ATYVAYYKRARILFPVHPLIIALALEALFLREEGGRHLRGLLQAGASLRFLIGPIIFLRGRHGPNCCALTALAFVIDTGPGVSLFSGAENHDK
ncbi:MAG: hypothetical protein ACLFUS_11085, partial [Candidatus Sumerlaeia bacterium]